MALVAPVAAPPCDDAKAALESEDRRLLNVLAQAVCKV